MNAMSQRMDAIPLQYFARLVPLLEEVHESGIDILRLDIGSPDLPPPEQAVRVLSQSAARKENHGYQPHRGTAPLREAWARFYQSHFGVSLDPEYEILPLLGSKEGIFHLAQALLNPGDVVLIPEPGYLTYRSSTAFAGAIPYVVELRAENDYLPQLDEIPEHIAEKARLLWLNYPNNPTGAIADISFFENLVAYAHRHQILLCHDAAYSQVTYDGHRAPSLLEIAGAKGVALEFNTLSKSHNMAGWRAGVALGNPEVLEALYTLKTHADSGHFLPIIEAATVVLEEDSEWLEARNLTYKTRRDLVASALDELGIGYYLPKGAIYVWLSCPPGLTSTQFTESLIRSTGVSLAPGSIFGSCGEGFVRLSLCATESRLTDALERLAHWLDGSMRGNGKRSDNE